jgi:arginase
MGPSAIRYAGLGERLRQLGYTVTDEGNVAASEPETSPIDHPHLKYLEPILAFCEQLASVVERASGPNDFPLVIGGDHSLALGSITGAAKARGSVGVIWIDAHPDFNTDQTTPSGNIHGMPLAALAGFGDERLTKLGGFSPKLSPANIAIVGARDIDPGERDLLRTAQVQVFTMKDIDRLGLPEAITQALKIATTGTNGLHVSFDMDSLDPREAPGVGTPVRGGITYREAHLAMELIADSGKLTSLDVVEVNPILDQENRTANLAVELILSALGKRIF